MSDHEVSDTSQTAEITDALRLAAQLEPMELRMQLRASALDPGRSGDGGFEGAVGTWLWERWHQLLEPLGADRDALDEVVCGYRREIWFWLLGDRRWDQVVEGLAGRTSRRLTISRDVAPQS